MGYNDCKKCGKLISRYSIDRETDYGVVRNYEFKLCWGCGFFSIYPNIRDEFTVSVMKDKSLIITLIEDKLLKPIL
jgi:hypothetical protein